jgi:phosphoglycolate phosphatase
MRYSVISFDLDGTLVDTAGEIAEAANRTLAEFGVPRQDVALITGFIGAGTRQMMLQLLAHVMLQEPALADRLKVDEVLARLEVHYGITAGMQAQPYPGCAEMLQRLREAGVKLACLTNKEHRFAIRVLDATGLLGLFDYVVGGDSLPQRKPHAQTMHHVLNVLGGHTHRAAHVGDSRTDVETARNAGVSAWAVPWGYNAGEPISVAQPDVIFDSLAAIAGHVLAANSDHAPAAAA